MHLVGKYPVLLSFHVFVVVVGVLILSGAVNTAIVGSNGVLNRVSEDGVLTDWFRHPQRKYRDVAPDYQYGGGGADHHDLGEPRRRYVSCELVRVWRDLEFCAEGRGRIGAALYASAGPRISRAAEFHGFREKRFRSGWGLITLMLVGIAIVNLFTKPDATIAGIVFTVVLFIVFEVSEYMVHRQASGRGARGARSI